MNADQKKRIAHEISNWKNACNCRAVQLTGDRMAALLQELIDAPAGSSSLIYHGDGTCTLKPGFKAVAYGGDTSANLIGLPPVGELQIDAAPAHAELPTWENGDDPLVGGGLISRGKVDFTALGIWPSKPAPDGLPLLISGAIYDFAGFLTTQEKTIQVGARVDASAVVDMLKEWAALRGLKLDDAAVLSWQEWLSPTPPEPPADVAPDAEPVAYVTGVYGGHTTVAPIDAAQVLRVGMALYTAPPATDQSEQHLGMVPADVARDAERLDWLLRKLPGGVLRYCVGVLSDTSDGKEFREAIDAAIERQGGKVE